MFGFFKNKRAKEDLWNLEVTVRLMDLRDLFEAKSVNIYIARTNNSLLAVDELPLLRKVGGGRIMFCGVMGGNLSKARNVGEVPRRRRNIPLMEAIVAEYYALSDDLDKLGKLLHLVEQMLKRYDLEQRLFVEIVQAGYENRIGEVLFDE